MTDHPITPPPELVERWYDTIDNSSTSWKQELATQAARWGADQELEACCEWLQDPDLNVDTYKLRAARRPKPPSLNKLALETFDKLGHLFHGYGDDGKIIRRALERLQELEGAAP